MVDFSPMLCPKTGKLEKQTVVREREDGVTLRCDGCGKEHSHEIGYFAYAANLNTTIRRGK